MKKLLLVTAVSASAFLSACGGGASTPAITPPLVVTPPPVVVTPPPNVVPANLQLTVPQPSYSLGSPELQAFTELNTIRQGAGLGLLAQNSRQDMASFNHASFIANNFFTNSAVFSHNQIAGLPGFTGLTPSDRAVFTGYGPLVGEELTQNVPPINGVAQLTPVMTLLNSVYHRSGLLDQCYRDVGIGQSTKINQAGNPFTPFVILLGYQSGCQTNASDFVMHYPLSGQVNVPLFMGAETPNPLPNLPLVNGSPDFSKTTSPISVTSTNGTTLTLTSIVVTAEGSTFQIPMNVITAQNDPNPQLARTNSIYFIGNAPFQSKTTYNVAFSGTVNGQNISQNWSFKTQ